MAGSSRSECKAVEGAQELCGRQFQGSRSQMRRRR